ncbi:MAG: PQQ-binding-like beta-propeller repeat protein [Pseudomonadota bacterium]
MTHLRSVSCVAGMLFLAGCGAANVSSSKGFDSEWQNDNGASIAAVEQRLRGLPPVPNARIVVGATDAGLAAATLDGKAHWVHSGRIASPPMIAGQLVIVAEGDRIIALDASSGSQVWSIDNRGLLLRGAANDGTLSALVLADTHKSLVLGVSASGSSLGSAETNAALGTPAARGGVAFVPWNNQYVSAVDLKSGAEVGRLLTREQVSRALNFGGTLYFGEKGLLRFDDKTRYASTNQGTHVTLPKLALPGKPDWLGSGAVTPTSEANARTKIRVYAAPSSAPSGELTIGGGTIAASYFRVVFGLDAKSADLRWVRTLPADVVGGAAAASGFVLCDANGKVWSLDSNGAEAGSLDLGSKVRLCAADTGAQPVPAAAGRPTLAPQIAQALDALEPDMAEAERYLIAQLGKLEDPLVTKTLIELSSSPRIPPELRTETRRLLGLRRNGNDYMLSALARHYDFVSGVLLPPPVGPLADALAANNETRAAPLLAKHLNDPANSAEDVAHAARALVKLASAGEYEDLRTFFALYRATADDDSLVAAVVACAEAILRIGGEAGRAVVERAAQDPLTQGEVRASLPSLLNKAPAAPGPEDPTKSAAAR